MSASFAFSKTSTLVVRNLVLRARIGALSHERHGEQNVRITVEMIVPTITDHGDKLENIVPYHPIVQKIRDILDSGHIELVETLAQMIVKAAFEEPRVEGVTVYVEKPDVIPEAESAGIRISATRSTRAGAS